MTLKELDNLVRSNLLKAQPANREEIDGLLKSGRARLADAKNTANSLESRFDLAYGAAHALALAALRLRGYRPNNKRFIVFQALPHTLELDAKIWRVLDKGHTARNAAEYEGIVDIDEQLLADMIKSTDIVSNELHKLAAQ